MLSNSLLVLASVLFAVSLMECGLRIRDYGSIARVSGEHSLRTPDPLRGWILRPGRAFQRTRDYAVTVAINDKGLRDRPHDYAPTPGTFRIVVLGDSFMEAYQVDLKESLPYRLQEDLSDRGVEVINLGTGGYGTAQAYLALREEGLRYEPDLVILAFYVNDISNNSRALEMLTFGENAFEVFGKPFARAEGPDAEIVWELPDSEEVERYVHKKQAKRSGAFRGIINFLVPTQVGNALERGLGPLLPQATMGQDPHIVVGWPFLNDFSPDHASPLLDQQRYEELWEEAWGVTGRLILETRDLSRSAGADFAVLYVPTIVQVDLGARERMEREFPGLAIDATRLNRILARFCSDHGIPLLDPLAAFEAESQHRSVFHMLQDHHWNAVGHEVATRELSLFLDREGLIPPIVARDR